MRFFSENFNTGKINTNEIEQGKLLKKMMQFKNRSRPGKPKGKDKKRYLCKQTCSL